MQMKPLAIHRRKPLRRVGTFNQHLDVDLFVAQKDNILTVDLATSPRTEFTPLHASFHPRRRYSCWTSIARRFESSCDQLPNDDCRNSESACHVAFVLLWIQHQDTKAYLSESS